MKGLKIIGVSFLLIALTLGLCSCVVKIAVPQIKEARFDFSVTYEINGEVKTYSGVYVCKYDGVNTTFLGSGIRWKGYIENEKEIDVPVQTNEDGVIYINFGLSPEYFMGDPYDYAAPTPNLFLVYNDIDPDSMYVTGEEDVIAGYGVKLISWEYADPIENSYKEQLSFSRFEPRIN